MILDATNAPLTNASSGMVIDYWERPNDYELVLVTKCGHRFVLRADTNHFIHHLKTDVSIALPGLDISSIIGQM